MSKQFVAIVVLVILAFVGVFAFTGKKSDTKSSSSGDTSQATNHVQGLGKSGITLVEYGDYQCPFCGQYYPIVKAVQQQYNDQIFFQFRNFPLTSIHQNAFAGARAAEAASKQGKFWEMHDLLYENQTQWSESSNPSSFFKQYAQQLGLNVDQFEKDYSSTAVNNAINADKAVGTQLKIDGTPTFFINGKKIDVNASVASFQKQIQQAIDQKSQSQN